MPVGSATFVPTSKSLTKVAVETSKAVLSEYSLISRSPAPSLKNICVPSGLNSSAITSATLVDTSWAVT